MESAQSRTLCLQLVSRDVAELEPLHDGPGAGRGGVGLIRARGEIQQLRYGERQEVGEQRPPEVAAE